MSLSQWHSQNSKRCEINIKEKSVSPCGTLVFSDHLPVMQSLIVPLTATLTGIYTLPILKVKTLRTATPWTNINTVRLSFSVASKNMQIDATTTCNENKVYPKKKKINPTCYTLSTVAGLAQMWASQRTGLDSALLTVSLCYQHHVINTAWKDKQPQNKKNRNKC